MPLRSVQTVRIVKLYKPLSQIRRENILSILNEMQFTDRIRKEKCLYDLYRPYGLFSDRISLSILDMSDLFKVNENVDKQVSKPTECLNTQMFKSKLKAGARVSIHPDV